MAGPAKADHLPGAGSSPPTVWFDYIDPISWLLYAECEAAGLTELDWCPLELIAPPSPLVTAGAHEISGRWREAARFVEASKGDVPATPHSSALVPWTRKAHELTLFAADHGNGREARRRIFDAYMLEGLDIGRIDVLVLLAEQVGLDRTETKATLDVDRYEASVADARARAERLGVRTSPCLVVGPDHYEGFHNAAAIRTFLGT